ncbi:MAG: hypothetical protein LBD03_00870 [Methanobrevibacter sp.]|jgi:hypothetical protein|nr:hypothetical protein [Candidatus Methanovirga procula]
MCGYEFDEKKVDKCYGKSGCSTVHCLNCGYGNSSEFEVIKTLKKKLGFK